MMREGTRQTAHSLITDTLRPMTTFNSTKRVDEIEAKLEECYRTAYEAGFDGKFDEYEFTAPDLHWVTEELGYKPTEAEWKEAGLGWVGGAHVADK